MYTDKYICADVMVMMCVCQQVIFRNDRFWHLLLSSILRTEDTLSAVSVAAGFGLISFMSEEWRNNPARVETVRLSSIKGGKASATVSAARAAAMGIFCCDGITGDGMGLALLVAPPPLRIDTGACNPCAPDNGCSGAHSLVCLIRNDRHDQRTHDHHGSHRSGDRPPRALRLWDSRRKNLGRQQRSDSTENARFFEQRHHTRWTRH